ncbi:MAG TPA: TonB-dependent receptor [Candidatus Limnocylindria bacterium]|nr:TonB-dependent receptor [Candidatus Limnocylindria bacterium]
MTRRLVRAALAAGSIVTAITCGVGDGHTQPVVDSLAAASDTLARIVPLAGVEVSTTRADARAPIARSVLGRDQILERNWGQDTPIALATLPGVYAYSDAGNGIGYSYLSIRGFPQRRISVLVNGVPLNDPESHEVYWIDHPDLLASTAELQVQRGVGSALYGAASVGGSVHLETSPFGERRRTAATLGYGSFETRRLMLESDSGRLPGGWNLYGRYSRIESQGYRERSDTELWSYAFSARKLLGDHSLRLNLYGGPEETHLAYLGVPRATLDGLVTGDRERDRRFNPILYEEERDHFFEPHYELIHAWSPTPWMALTHTAFYFDGEGFYDEQRFGRSLTDFRLAPWATSDSTLFPRTYYRDADADGALDRDAQGRVTVERFDVVRRRLVRNRHYGWVPRLRMEHAGGALTVGGELRAHDGRHIGTVIAGSGLPPGTGPDHRFYDYHPRTLSAGLFLREEWELNSATRLTADLAWRHQDYAMRGDRFDGIRFDQPYDFALPRLGLSYTPRADLTLFAAWAQSRREPAFRDLYDAEGAGSVPLFQDGEPLIRPEKVDDYELGGAWGSKTLGVTANLFWMDFEDELVFAGQFNTDLGYSIIGNAARSVHRGIELAGRSEHAWGAGWSASLDANSTLSWNAFREYREVFGTNPGDTLVYDGNTIGFFPGVLGNLSVRLGWRNTTVGVEARHAGRIFLDNTETMGSSIGPNTVLNLVGGHRFALEPVGGVELSVRVLNLLDREYETGGYMDFDAGGNLVPHFIPAAKRHVLGQIRVEFQ